MDFGVLGPLLPADVTRPAQKRLLSILLLNPMSEIDRDLLVDRMWGESPPASARNSLQVHINGLRKLLPADLIETTPQGYRIVAEPDSIGFASLVAEAETADQASQRHELAVEAIRLWRGAPYPDLGDDEFARPEIVRLQELHLRAHEISAAALIDLSRAAETIPELRQLIEIHPLRERLRGHLMLALYLTGRQAEALREYQDIRGTLGEELGIEPSLELRDLEERILLQDESLGRAETTTPPTNLRALDTSFVGRDSEMEALTDALADHRVVTLSGGPGFGKTRLATELGHASLNRYRDGVWFVPLAGATSSLDVAAEIATATNAHVEVKSIEDLARHVAKQRVLVILDNCEHVIDPCRAFASAVASSGGTATVLATSRRPLGVHGEHVVRVSPFTSPTAGVDAALTNPSIQLFVDRAHSVDRGFALTDQSVEAIDALVRGLAGIPLAIELAARWVSALTIEEITSMIESSDLAPKTTDEDGAQSLDSAIDWSLDLLARDDRDLLIRTAVFHAPYTLDDSYQICDDGRTRAQFSAAMARLVDSSLVAVNRQGPNLRYYSLAPISDRLHTLGDDTLHLVKPRHSAHFLALAGEGCDELYKATPDMARITEVIPDIRAALEHGLGNDRDDEVGAALSTLSQYFHKTYLEWESQHWLDRVLQRDLSPEIRGYALRARGSGAQILGRQREAAEAFEEAIEIFDSLGRKDWAMRCLLSLSGVYSDRGDWGRGTEAAARILDFVSQGDAPSAVAMARYYIGENTYRGGDPAAALPDMRTAAEMFVGTGESSRVAYTASQAARAALHAGDMPEARRLAELSCQHARTSPSGYTLTTSLSTLALVETAEAKSSEASTHIIEADQHVTPGHPDVIYDVLLPSASVFAARQEWERVAEIVTDVRSHISATENEIPVPWQEVMSGWLEHSEDPDDSRSVTGLEDLRARIVELLGDL